MTLRAFGLASLAIGFAVAGEVAGWELMSQLAMVCLALLVLTWIWSRSALSGLVVERSISPANPQVGEVLEDTIEVRSQSQVGKMWIEVRDRSQLPGHDASRVIGLRRRGKAQWMTRSICVKRGVFRLGPIELRGGDPLGVFTRVVRVNLPTEVMVYPPVFELPALRLPFADASGRTELERRAMLATPSVSTVRDYVAGDPLNKIAWSITARTGRLMVKEFDLDPTSEIWVIADFGASASVAAERRVLIERADRFDFAEAWFDSSTDMVAALAASIASVAMQRKRAIGYVGANAVRKVLQAEASERQFYRVLEALAMAKSDGQEQLADLLVDESRRFDRNRTPVVVTSSLDQRWLKALEGLTTRGVRPIGVFVDPGSLNHSIDSTAFRVATSDQRFPVFAVNFSAGIAAAFAHESASPLQSPGPGYVFQAAAI